MSASPPFSLHWTETSPALLRNSRTMPVFRDYSPAKRTAENALLASNAVIALAFLRRHMRSPVSKRSCGECNAIRSWDPAMRVDFWRRLRNRVDMSHMER
jgi:hypothetical protein